VLAGGRGVHAVGFDLAVLVGTGALLVAAAGWLYPRVVT
jgi:hypothetical protein